MEKVLLLFVDSGFLYCALWVRSCYFYYCPKRKIILTPLLHQTLLVADICIDRFGFGQLFSIDTVKWRFTDHIDLFLGSALIDVIVRLETDNSKQY